MTDYSEGNVHKKKWLPQYPPLTEYLIHMAEKEDEMNEIQKYLVGDDLFEIRENNTMRRVDGEKLVALYSDHLQAITERDNHIAQSEAVLESINSLLEGDEPSDFMLSFGIVRRVADLMEKIKHLESLLKDAASFLAEQQANDLRLLVDKNDKIMQLKRKIDDLTEERDDLQTMLVSSEPPYYTKWKEAVEKIQCIGLQLAEAEVRIAKLGGF